MTVIAPLASRFNALRSYAANAAWGPLVTLSRSAVMAVLTRMRQGRLDIVDVDGGQTLCGRAENPAGTPRTTLRVHKDAFWVRMALFADMGFAESYMLGEVSCPDLTAFFELFILNREDLSDGSTLTSSISSNIAGLARATNTLSNARLNIAAHYDISNGMFATFLSPDMTYSCPIWLPKSSPLSINETLEAAQMRKLDRFINNAHLKSTDHVLEIGTGWGSFAIRAVQRTGCQVTSLTLSTEQKELAEERIREAGLEDRIKVLLCDYRALPPPQNPNGAYDKIVSIEMLEAVGKEFLVTYFECINRLLKKNGGIAVFQCITMPETRYDAYASSDDFIRRYIFPGGHLPTVSQLVSSINAGSRKTLIVDDIENIGPHYAKTLRLWREEFMRNFEEKIKPALLIESEKRGQPMGKKDVETFKRKWEYYFTYCEAGFRAKTLGDVIITVGREGAVEMMEDAPL
ncbi:Cyclopropane-fatty-acyl-phospholipid/mycolic acid synthase [Macrophomina phaseolina MS6]|uniref:Cyclopropane-fatty-acyl-phospholipid/mycolic acid synthase n=1 Tax=Macrophomina phaseolina (strain MS6) TaxID=1126212 RepID=K2QUM5_MACPH|nr:Cyclopropane-fatty-acyl-phospholipid/mycolic acid synthase [Macrophomina phaseolina MS6]